MEIVCLSHDGVQTSVTLIISTQCYWVACYENLIVCNVICILWDAFNLLLSGTVGSDSNRYPVIAQVLVKLNEPLTKKCSYLSGNFQVKATQLTNFSRQTFSLKAPIHPVNPRINMILPTMISAKAGSITMSLKKSWYAVFSNRA